MKKVYFTTVLLMITIFCFSQQTESLPSQPVPNTDYLKKSKHQKAAGWVLTGIGTVGLVATLNADAAQAIGGSLTTLFSLGTVEPDYTSYTGYYLLSGACLASGIAYLAAASKNKKKAKAINASTYFRMENATVLKSIGIVKHSYPSVGMRINIH